MYNSEALEKTNTPLYFQLEHIIRSKILIGEFMPGDQIPTEKDFCMTYKISSVTVRQAILNLVKEGLLVRKQGKGTFVREGIQNIDKIRDIKTFKISGDIQNLVPEGIMTQKVNVIDIIKMKAPTRVAVVLNLEVGAEVVQVTRLRSEHNINISYIINYLPLEIGERLNREDLSQYSMLHILKDKLGILLHSGVQYIDALSADHTVASALSIGVFSPILYLETMIFAEQRKPVDFVQTFYRPDQFKYSVDLEFKRD